MFAKIVSFEGYEDVRLVLEIAAPESVETFCKFVANPRLAIRDKRRSYRHSTPRSRVLTLCECCGRLVYLQLPFGAVCLCSRCYSLAYKSTSFSKSQQAVSEWSRGEWD